MFYLFSVTVIKSCHLSIKLRKYIKIEDGGTTIGAQFNFCKFAANPETGDEYHESATVTLLYICHLCMVPTCRQG